MYQLLIVDDQPDLVEDLASNLPWESVGVETVYQAHSAAGALEIMNATPIDIVITDIHMPGQSGLDLIAQIRSSWSNVKCILLSGYNDFEYAQRALQHQATDYLLKPAEDEDLLQAVKKAAVQLEEHWQAISSHHSALHSLKDNLPILRSHLLLSLLQGEAFTSEKLADKLDMLDFSFTMNEPYGLMLLRMEDYFYEQTERDNALLEYAVCNIAEEIFSEEYKLWHTKDGHGYYVFVIMSKAEAQQEQTQLLHHMEQKAAQLQHYVKLYLKGTVSLVLTKQDAFPHGIHETYDFSLINFRQRIGSERGFLLTVTEEAKHGEANSLSHLYNPPLFIHLFEAGQWDAIEEKLRLVFEELELKWGESHEHILETYFMIVSSLSFSIHKNKLWMADIMGAEFNQLLSGPHFHTIKQLRSWTESILAAYRNHMSSRVQHSRSSTVQKVQEYVSGHLEDASLQSIAAHVFLNPSYLSKIYKLETGEGISEYISRLKMETAAHMLRTAPDKIYEIAAKVGYLKTSYFIKVFKDRYGITPQEFRDR
ncbi:two-component system response regulator YesN [Paenibacillus endophyticus]|uniref:Two-component system response regulator YesN n=1 Tax=Paenibacillus endophyticus TaxID=1294268 RepID=A0A7W5G811_9BACL|nr:response regulator [Paenibacillus endophyticus]MBB3150131.1 two-component system response regulator YesN [Paenibacillus endophyticus]